MVIWYHTDLEIQLFDSEMQVGSRANPVNWLQRCSAFNFVIPKGSDAGIRLSAPVNQNHPSRGLMEQQLQWCSPPELGDGDILIQTSTSAVNNTHQQHMLPAVIYPAWRNLKKASPPLPLMGGLTSWECPRRHTATHSNFMETTQSHNTLTTTFLWQLFFHYV